MRCLPAAVLLLLTACQAAFAPARPKWPPFPDGHYMWVGQFIQVTGTGRPGKRTANQTQERSEARDAAIVDAWGRLRAYISELPLERGGTVAGAAARNPALTQIVERFVFSAQIVETRYDGPTAVVVVRVDAERLNNLLGTDFR